MSECEESGKYICETASTAYGCSGAPITSPTCYRRLTCAEINSDYVTSCNTVTAVFSPNGYIGWAGDIDQVCGHCCYKVSPAWFQTVGGNLYGQTGITVELGSGNGTTANPYLTRQSGNFTAAFGNTSGLPLSYSNTIEMRDGELTQRSINNTKASSTPGYPSSRVENFTYFKNLLNYASLPACNNDLPNLASDNVTGSQVCKQSGHFLLNRELTVSGKKVIFVEGDLHLNSDAKITVNPGNYLAFIVQGNIIIDGNIGEEIYSFGLPVDVGSPTSADNSQAYNRSTQLEGVFFADGEVQFNSAHTTAKCNINGQQGDCISNAYCDKKLTIAGSYIGWGGVKLNRTFKGCSERIVTNDEEYANYNYKNPVITFIYRPDFTLNTPDWMKQTITMRTETN